MTNIHVPRLGLRADTQCFWIYPSLTDDGVELGIELFIPSLPVIQPDEGCDYPDLVFDGDTLVCNFSDQKLIITKDDECRLIIHGKRQPEHHHAIDMMMKYFPVSTISNL